MNELIKTTEEISMTQFVDYSKKCSREITTIRQAIDGTSLATINKYSGKSLRLFLIKMIGGMLTYFGYNPSKDMTDQQFGMVVTDILEKYYYLTFEDVSLCFKKARTDPNYRRFYGRVDCSVILDWLSKYCQEREEIVIPPKKDDNITDNLYEVLLYMAAGGDEDAYQKMILIEMLQKRMNSLSTRAQLNVYRYNQKHKFDKKIA